MNEGSAHEPRDAPSPWVVRFAPLVASGARVLDLASGGGRHARFFAARGARVVAVDRDPAAGNAAYGRPSNPDFLLTPGELLEFARSTLTVVAFEQGVVNDERPAVIQRLAAVGRGRPWPPPLA